MPKPFVLLFDTFSRLVRFGSKSFDGMMIENFYFDNLKKPL